MASHYSIITRALLEAQRPIIAGVQWFLTCSAFWQTYF
jgi:hypothetical protein